MFTTAFLATAPPPRCGLPRRVIPPWHALDLYESALEPVRQAHPPWSRAHRLAGGVTGRARPQRTCPLTLYRWRGHPARGSRAEQRRWVHAVNWRLPRRWTGNLRPVAVSAEPEIEDGGHGGWRERSPASSISPLIEQAPPPDAACPALHSGAALRRLEATRLRSSTISATFQLARGRTWSPPGEEPGLPLRYRPEIGHPDTDELSAPSGTISFPAGSSRTQVARHRP